MSKYKLLNIDPTLSDIISLILGKIEALQGYLRKIHDFKIFMQNEDLLISKVFQWSYEIHGIRCKKCNAGGRRYRPVIILMFLKNSSSYMIHHFLSNVNEIGR